MHVNMKVHTEYLRIIRCAKDKVSSATFSSFTKLINLITLINKLHNCQLPLVPLSIMHLSMTTLDKVPELISSFNFVLEDMVISMNNMKVFIIPLNTLKFMHNLISPTSYRIRYNVDMKNNLNCRAISSYILCLT